MLFDLFQLVFHAYDDALHFGLVRLGTERVDFATHLLADEAQLLALALAGLHGLEKIFQVVVEPVLLFVDVEFLDIENHLLLEPVFVVVEVVDFGQGVDDASLDLLDALLFVGTHGLLESTAEVVTGHDLAKATPNRQKPPIEKFGGRGLKKDWSLNHDIFMYNRLNDF